MIAKIAHSYAVAELGVDAFKSTLTPAIRNQPQRMLEFVGGDWEVPPAKSHLHDIHWRVQTVGRVNYVVVSLRLFAFMGSPQYHIVAGELTRPLDQLPFLEQPLYTIDIKQAVPFGQAIP
jgi:hypothetical protein